MNLPPTVSALALPMIESNLLTLIKSCYKAWEEKDKEEQ